MSQKIVAEGACGEIVEKKSRFIASIMPVSTEEEALSFIQEKKKQYWDARHNCSAYIIGRKNPISRCSDDGEPSQTAGRPMLDVLEREGIYDVVVVVTRYFGGVLLGTGGLVRAYQAAVQEGLKNCRFAKAIDGYECFLTISYTAYGQAEYILREEGIEVIDSDFEEQVRLHFYVPVVQRDSLTSKLTDATNGSAEFDWSEEMTYFA